jgi:oxygen-dependent protoporphyrinogen oxidase
MNGAEPDEVYLGTLGTNLRSLLDTYDQPKQGMRPLFSRFAAQVPVQLGVKVRDLVIRAGKVVAVSIERSGRREELPCSGVVLATPAAAGASLLEPHLGRVAAALRQTRYFPVLVVVARYGRPVFSPAVRALVFGAESPLSNAGAYGVEALDTVRYTFSGRAARKALNGGTDVTSLLEQAEDRLARYTQLRRVDRLEFVARRFDPGLCAYSPRHGALHRALEGATAAVRGLALTGDYVCGASIEACFRAARSAVTQSLARA